LKNTFNSKGMKMLKLLIQPQQQQAHPSFHQTQRIWILQSLNTLDSTISPYLMKTNPWLLVLDLIESKAVSAKQSLRKAQYL